MITTESQMHHWAEYMNVVYNLIIRFIQSPLQLTYVILVKRQLTKQNMCISNVFM